MRIRSGASALITPPLAIPLAFVALLTLAYAFPFFEVPWPFVDVYEVLLKAESLSWRATVVKAFTEGVEYRPFFMVLVKALYDWVGLNLWFYKVIVLIQFALIFGAVVAILRPSTMQRAIAACLAVGCVAGLHTTRVLFSFFPVAHHSLVTLIVLAVVALALQEQRRVHPALVFVVTLTGLLFIEFGLLIPPLLLVLWLMRAPNASPRVVAASWIALAVYVAIRWGIGVQDDFGISHNETGIGFAMMDGKEIERVFGSAPWLFWAYNILANLFTVLFSEPRSGIYLFVRGVMRGATYPWMWVHVISSLATTIAIAWFLVERSVS